MISITNRKSLQQRAIYALEGLEQRYFLSAGFIDRGFGEDGFVSEGRVVPEMGFDIQVLIQPDGKILVAGSESSEHYYEDRLFLARYNKDGSVDSTFGEQGLFESYQGAFDKMAIQKDGKILVAGSAGLTRLNADGSIDPQFGDQGVVISQTPISDMVLLSSGKIVLGKLGSGISGYGAGLVRLNEDGTVDSTFSWQPRAPLGMEDCWRELQEQPDGSLVVLVDTWIDSNASYLMRFEADGQLDNTFRTGLEGDFTPITPDTYAWVEDVELESSGEIIVLTTDATVEGRVALYRYGTNGGAESHWGKNGADLFPSDEAQENRLTLMHDGKIVVWSWGEDMVARRFGRDGKLDSTFGRDGTATLGAKAKNDDTIDMGMVVGAEDADGRLVLVKEYFDLDGRPQIMLTRLTSDQDPTPSEENPVTEPDTSQQLSNAENVGIEPEDDSQMGEESFFSDDSIDVLGNGDVPVWD